MNFFANMEFSLTSFLAVWGALLSTLAIAWNIRRDLKDRGYLKISCYLGSEFLPGMVAPLGSVPTETGIASGALLLVYSITNVGRKAIVVKRIGGTYKKGAVLDPKTAFMIMKGIDYPKTLNPGDPLVVTIGITQVEVDALKKLTVEDTHGRVYQASRGDLRRIKEGLKEVESKSA